jgi:hypothetical protein
MKVCTSCKRPVDYSLCAVVSTNRISPRLQRCSTSVPLCKECFGLFLAGGNGKVEAEFRRTLRPTFEHLIAQMKTICGF